MSLSEWAYLISLNETSWETSGFQVTNPFAGDVEDLHRTSPQAEIAPQEVIVNMFLDDVG